MFNGLNGKHCIRIHYALFLRQPGLYMCICATAIHIDTMARAAKALNCCRAGAFIIIIYCTDGRSSHHRRHIILDYCMCSAHASRTDALSGRGIYEIKYYVTAHNLRSRDESHNALISAGAEHANASPLNRNLIGGINAKGGAYHLILCSASGL